MLEKEAFQRGPFGESSLSTPLRSSLPQNPFSNRTARPRLCLPREGPTNGAPTPYPLTAPLEGCGIGERMGEGRGEALKNGAEIRDEMRMGLLWQPSDQLRSYHWKWLWKQAAWIYV
ncbi:hypothetical protein CEXT_309591 [Caerostris extrusa]|uniref:Uncharacterized protein n=1 Tax=Caerostris extrusa TaxID=172846 RepID=A0AAV4NHI9_CAEEX|nr:hypothetical protein CEXT_309591 [Caerostris extrusa]